MMALILVLTVGTASPPPSSSPVPAAVPTRAAISVSPLDLVAIIKAAYSYIDRTKNPILIQKKISDMPEGLPARYYAGKDSAGRPIFWIADPRSGSITENKNISPDLWINSMVVAGAMAAADSGAAGPRWKQLYDSAPDKVALARAIISAYQEQSDQAAANSKAQIDWIRRSFHPGMQRSTVYSMLKSRRLVAYNWDYNPGKKWGSSGCEYQSTRPQSYWPKYKQPLPKRTGICADHQPKFVVNPTAYIDFVSGFNFACGKQINVSLEFDRRDKLARIVVPKESEICM